MRGFSVALGLAAAALVALGPSTPPALAHPAPDDLAAKFARGEYMAAAAAAEAAAGADDLAFAARSLLAHCMTGTRQIDAAILDRARRDAEAALDLDPGHEEGRLQLAIALSLKSRGMDVMAAWNTGYGQKARRLAEEVLGSDPRNPYAHGFLAVWNLEVEQRGGGMGAWLMGASRDSARRHYDAARAVAPDDVGIHWQYARALAALDIAGRWREVREALDRALAAAATDHVEQVMQARARQLADAMATGRDAAQVLARSLL